MNDKLSKSQLDNFMNFKLDVFFNKKTLYNNENLIEKASNVYHCIFPKCKKTFKTYFRWNIHHNSHVKYFFIFRYFYLFLEFSLRK